jgi:hypothetical protein
MRVSQFQSTYPKLLLGLLLPICCVSCTGGPKLYPVHGKLLQNNRPVAGALLTFHPKDGTVYTVLPTGLTDDDGTFTLETGANEGAPAGDYVVTLIAPEVVKAGAGQKKASMGRKPDSADRFKGAYTSEAGSKLRVEIKQGENNLEPFVLN